MDEQLNNYKRFSSWFRESIKGIYGTGCQSKFSKHTGFPLVTVSRWCSGNRIPSGYSLALIIQTIAEQQSAKNEIDYNDAFDTVSTNAVRSVLGLKNDNI